MDRRIFLRNSAIAAAAFTIPFLNSCRDNHLDPALNTPGFLSHITDRETLLGIGREYRKKFPAEDDRNVLTDLLMKDHPSSGSADPAGLSAWFDRKISDDFNRENTVVVKGWVLSQTEARQCALFSFIS